MLTWLESNLLCYVLQIYVKKDNIFSKYYRNLKNIWI